MNLPDRKVAVVFQFSDVQDQTWERLEDTWDAEPTVIAGAIAAYAANNKVWVNNLDFPPLSMSSLFPLSPCKISLPPSTKSLSRRN
jgi:hypothetical protein